MDFQKSVAIAHSLDPSPRRLSCLPRHLRPHPTCSQVRDFPATQALSNGPLEVLLGKPEVLQWARQTEVGRHKKGTFLRVAATEVLGNTLNVKKGFVTIPRENPSYILHINPTLRWSVGAFNFQSSHANPLHTQIHTLVSTQPF